MGKTKPCNRKQAIERQLFHGHLAASPAVHCPDHCAKPAMQSDWWGNSFIKRRSKKESPSTSNIHQCPTKTRSGTQLPICPNLVWFQSPRRLQVSVQKSKALLKQRSCLSPLRRRQGWLLRSNQTPTNPPRAQSSLCLVLRRRKKVTVLLHVRRTDVCSRPAQKRSAFRSCSLKRIQASLHVLIVLEQDAPIFRCAATQWKRH